MCMGFSLFGKPMKDTNVSTQCLLLTRNKISYLAYGINLIDCSHFLVPLLFFLTHHVKPVSACTAPLLLHGRGSKKQLWHNNLLVWSYRLHWIENNPTRTEKISALIVIEDTEVYYINQLVSSTPMQGVTNRAGPTKWERRASLWRWTFLKSEHKWAETAERLFQRGARGKERELRWWKRWYLGRREI